MATVFVGRDGSNKIITVVGISQPGAIEAISTTDSGVIAFLTQSNLIPFNTFIQRWLPAEYALLWQKRATAIGAGNAVLAQQWDMAAAAGFVDLSSTVAQNFKAMIVAASILTQARADVIFT